MSEPKFKIGDQVRVVNYGHYICEVVGESFRKVDINPEVVGKVGTVSVVSSGNQYAIEGIPGKHSWYNEDQLELVAVQTIQSPRNPKEEAQRLIAVYYKMSFMISYDYREGMTIPDVIKNISIHTIQNIIKALEITTGHCTLNDQDRIEVRRDIDYWREVEREIHKLWKENS